MRFGNGIKLLLFDPVNSRHRAPAPAFFSHPILFYEQHTAQLYFNRLPTHAYNRITEILNTTVPLTNCTSTTFKGLNVQTL